MATFAPHVERAVLEINRRFPRLGNGGTYPEHGEDSATGKYAADFWATNKDVHDEAFPWLRANAKRLGIKYIISWKRIWSVARASEGVRPYTRYGNTTNPSQLHTNHIHISFNVTPPKAEPEPTPQPALGVPLMADAESIDLPAYNGNQALSTEGGRVHINAEKHTTVVGGSAKGIDVIAGVAVEGLKAGEYVNLWWRIEEKHATKPDRTVRGKIHVPITPSSTHHQPAAQISYKGSLPKAEAGWTSCLRLMYSTNSKTAKIARVDFDGWKVT